MKVKDGSVPKFIGVFKENVRQLNGKMKAAEEYINSLQAALKAKDEVVVPDEDMANRTSDHTSTQLHLWQHPNICCTENIIDVISFNNSVTYHLLQKLCLLHNFLHYLYPDYYCHHCYHH